jgi:branched-chain amino acid transport system substrate-binding protein
MQAVNKLKLGWLFPYSGIFKNLKTDLKQGLETALQKEDINTSFEVFPEFIQTGGFKDTEDALKKLLLFEQVDLVIGVTSTKVALGLLPTLEAQRTPVILMNLGADIPTRQLSSDFLFYNSLHLWKSEWVMGKWAQKQYGGEPSINMSIYEGGYGLHESFRTGTSVSGAQTVKMNVVKNFETAADTNPLIEFIRQQQPNHTHALLSGREGEQFLQLFANQVFESKPALTVNPFMAEDGMLTEMPAGMDLYSAMTWSLALDNTENSTFTNLYKTSFGEDPNAFSMLAYETGLTLAAALRNLPGKINREELAKALGHHQPAGPRGPISLSSRILQTNMPVYIRKPEMNNQNSRMENRILEIEYGIEWDDPSLAAEQTYLTGWQNPYLCV